MAIPFQMSHFFTSAWPVFMLFLIPIGGGIPVGVLLARDQGLIWPVTAFLYLVSDVVLACLFEPVLHGLITLCRNSPKYHRFSEAAKMTLQKTTATYGKTPGPMALVLIAFGVDPMTGRAATVAAGHGFVSGWALAITGDMIYFAILMISTLWLDGFLGNGTWTTVIILVAMIAVPALVKRVRGANQLRVKIHEQ